MDCSHKGEPLFSPTKRSNSVLLPTQVNPSSVEWPLQAVVSGSGFTGPEFLLAQALSTTGYPLTFDPRREGTIEVYTVTVQF